MELPYLKPTDVLSHLVATYPWILLGGLQPGDSAKEFLASFWRCYKLEHGTHEVYKLAEQNKLQLEFTIPLVLHGDGGRTLKKQPLEIVSIGPVLGLDTDQKKMTCTCEHHQEYSGTCKGDLMAQRLNMKNNSYLTHFLLFAFPSKKYKQTPGLLKSLLNAVSLDLGRACRDGVVHCGNLYHFAVLGMKGDLEYHAKCGLLTRSYMNVGHRNPIPCCSECGAGGPGLPFEDCRVSAAWRGTMYQDPPWVQQPPFHPIPFEDWDSGLAARFFKRDTFHIFRLGIARNFIGPAIVLLCHDGFLDSPGDGYGVDDRLNRAWASFTLWCNAHRLNPSTIRSFSRQKLHYPTAASFPWLSCKGSDTVLLLRWLLFFAKLHLTTAPQNQVLQLIAGGSENGLNFGGIYRHGIWLKPLCRNKIMKNAGRFNSAYSRLAALAYERGLQLFAMVPKFHALDHIKVALEPSDGEVALNPATWDCSMSEDFIGHVARQSRRVSHIRVVENTLLAYKVKARFVITRFKKARRL